MAFEPNSLIKQDCSNFISTGSAGEIEDLQGEDWSANLVVEYDLPEPHAQPTRAGGAKEGY